MRHARLLLVLSGQEFVKKHFLLLLCCTASRALTGAGSPELTF